MIKECTGCYACYNVCPQNAITMDEDNYGFQYPTINKEKCINCGLCEKICPVLHKEKVNNQPKAYACINKNENIRKQSSSGGIFTLLAEKILDLGGVVFGAQFDEDFNVIHSYVENKEDLYKFRGSKYVQSQIGASFKKVRQFLNEGRCVLFTGTPCQIEGLYSYLSKEYEKLYTQDIICHGIPSPKVWRKYIKSIEDAKKYKLTNANLRNKTTGWLTYSFKYQLENKKTYTEYSFENKYMQLFLKSIILRESCYNCHFKSKNRKSDITLADFWGIQNVVPKMFDNKGTSLVIVNSQKGNELFNKIKQDIKYIENDFEESIKYNPSMTKSTERPKSREEFFEKLENEDLETLAEKYVVKENTIKRNIIILKNIVYKLKR